MVEVSDFAVRYREESMRRAYERLGQPFQEESLRKAIARKEEFIRQLLDGAAVPEIEDIEPGELSYAEIKRAASAPEMLQIVLTAPRSRLWRYGLPLNQITSRVQAEWDAAGLHGLALTNLPAEVHAFVRMVADLLEVRPGSSFLFVQSAEQCGLPEGAYGLCSEGVESPFTWWVDTALLDGLLVAPDGWRVKGTAESSCLVGIYPA